MVDGRAAVDVALMVALLSLAPRVGLTIGGPGVVRLVASSGCARR
jgi:hypothetical protein